MEICWNKNILWFIIKCKTKTNLFHFLLFSFEFSMEYDTPVNHRGELLIETRVQNNILSHRCELQFENYFMQHSYWDAWILFFCFIEFMDIGVQVSPTRSTEKPIDLIIDSISPGKHIISPPFRYATVYTVQVHTLVQCAANIYKLDWFHPVNSSFI